MPVAQILSLTQFTAFFTEELEAAADQIEATDRIPVHILDRAAELGIYRLTLPEQWGGWGLSVQHCLPYLEAAGMGPGCGRMLTHVSNGIWRPIAAYGTLQQQSILQDLGRGSATIAFCLTERAGGSGRDIHSRAVREGEGWRVSGEKHLITFADRADYFLLIVATDERHAADSFTAFLVPRQTEGFEIDISQATMGLHGTGHGVLRYDGMRVDDSVRLGGIGQGLEVGFSFLDYSRVSLSACMVGLAQRALDESLGYARRRVTFGRPIAERQAIQTQLADMHVDINAGRGLVRAAALRCERGEPFTVDAATAKLFCMNMAGRVTDLALRIHGGFGYTKNAPIERIYRDARGFWFEEGTAEIQQFVIARHLLSR